MSAQVRTFDTGATRDLDAGKLDYEGFLCPLVLRRYAAYMHKHRILPDGGLRASDNWQQGIPREVYMKSGFRHFMDWWTEHRGHPTPEGLEDALCALLFNAMGYLREHLAAKPAERPETPLSPAAERAIARAENDDDSVGDEVPPPLAPNTRTGD